MKKSFDHAFIHGNDGLVAVSLGADTCAEHEWGIAGLRRKFGIPNEGIGLARRKITQVPETLIWKDGTCSSSGTQFSGIFLSCNSQPWDGEPAGADFPTRVGSFDEKTHLNCAWDETSFMVLAKRPREIEKLKSIYRAIQELDLCILLSGGGLFKNPGLTLSIASKLPAHVIQGWTDADTEQAQLKLDMAATGIEKYLRDHGKQWFALTPRRPCGKKTGLTFWLNPYEQDEDNYGQFTLQELQQWAKGTGPIPKRQRRCSRR